MSTKIVLLKRQVNDQAKLSALNAINPKQVLEYASSSQLAGLPTDLGNCDYLLVTGGHGNFLNGKPTKFNDADITDAMAWISKVKGSFKAIILDTCFSAALAGSFMRLLPNGGGLVCAYGSGEGWAGSFTTANGARKVGTVLSGIIDGFADVYGGGAASSIGLAIKKPTNQLLHTGMTGASGKASLAARALVSPEVDSKEELMKINVYLKRDRITVVEASNENLKKSLVETLSMTVA